MQVPRTLPLAVTGATLALVVAGTAVASAHGPRDDRPFAGERRAFAGGELGDLGMFGRLGPRLGPAGDGIVRTESVVDLGEAGFLTRRIDQGTVTSVGASELSYTLANGETATVSTDDDTQVLALSEVSEDDGTLRLRRRAMTLDEVMLADIPSDAGVVVWSESGDAGTFVAQRIVVQPPDAVAEAEDTAAEDASADADESVAPSV